MLGGHSDLFRWNNINDCFWFSLLQNVLNSVWQICDKLWQKVCHTFCSGIRSQSNRNQIQTTHCVSIVSISIVQFCFWSFSPQDARNPMWHVRQKVCHTFVTHLSQPDSPSRKVPIESRGKTYRWVGPLGHPDTANPLQKLGLAFWARFDRFWGSLG